jgi:hypothetical protein
MRHKIQHRVILAESAKACRDSRFTEMAPTLLNGTVGPEGHHDNKANSSLVDGKIRGFPPLNN